MAGLLSALNLLLCSECQKGGTDSAVFLRFISQGVSGPVNAPSPIHSASSLSQPLGPWFMESLGATLALVIASSPRTW